MNNSKDSPQQATYKKGDIVWVLYRGKVFYPARVNAFYPKERKISHIWFPLNRKSINAIFKADMGKVRPFTLEDSLPDNASRELEYSYEQAVRILQGTSIEEILEESDRMMAENGSNVKKQKTSAKKSTTTTDSLTKSVASPTTTKQQHKSQQQQQVAPIVVEPQEVLFMPGDPIIVDTSIGMWPGIFHSYVENPEPDSDDIRYTLFPRDPSSDILPGKKTSIVHFPLAHIEQSINEGIGSDMLMEALRDALQYVKVRNAQQEAASASIGMNISSQNEQFLKTLPSSSEVVDNTASIINEQPIVTSKVSKNVTKKKNNVPAQKMAPRGKDMKKEIAQQPEDHHEHEEEEESSNSVNIDTNSMTTSTAAIQPQPKTFVTDKRFRLSSTSSVEICSPFQPPQVKKAKSINTDIEHNESELTDEEKQQQLELFPQKDGGSSTSTTTTYKNSSKKHHNGHRKSPPLPTITDLPPTLLNESEPMDFELNKNIIKSTSPQKHLIGTNFVGKSTLYELASSDEAHRHMQQIWEEFDDNWFNNVECLQLDFRSGGLLTFKETEKLILEIEKWIKMENITPMSHFHEQFYIAKYVLPELCTFAISKMQDISMMDARRIYEERREKNKHQTGGVNSTSPNSLDTLVMAANMKMAEEQNGGGINEGK